MRNGIALWFQTPTLDSDESPGSTTRSSMTLDKLLHLSVAVSSLVKLDNSTLLMEFVKTVYINHLEPGLTQIKRLLSVSLLLDF